MHGCLIWVIYIGLDKIYLAKFEQNGSKKEAILKKNVLPKQNSFDFLDYTNNFLELLVQPSSAAAESVFSILQHFTAHSSHPSKTTWNSHTTTSLTNFNLQYGKIRAKWVIGKAK